MSISGSAAATRGGLPRVKAASGCSRVKGQRRSGPPRSPSTGWLVASYLGAVAFFALEAVTREPGEASELAATAADRGTTRLIGASYGVASGLSPVLRRLPIGRMPSGTGPVGVAVMAAGLALRAWSMQTLGSHYSRTLRTTSDQAVVDRGPYSLVRHPGYLGSIMVWTGFGIASGSAPAALAVVALLGTAYQRRIAAEEEMLTRTLGAAYANYSRRTKKLIPFIW